MLVKSSLNLQVQTYNVNDEQNIQKLNNTRLSKGMSLHRFMTNMSFEAFKFTFLWGREQREKGRES